MTTKKSLSQILIEHFGFSLQDLETLSKEAEKNKTTLPQPDIIIVGEIRDQETAQVVIETALTGHLVFSTIHTNDASSVVARLYEMGIPAYLIANTLEGVLAQRLVRALYNECKQPDLTLPQADFLDILKEHNIDFSSATFMKPVGCKKCGYTGMKGRTAIHELLIMNKEVRNLCLKGISANIIR